MRHPRKIAFAFSVFLVLTLTSCTWMQFRYNEAHTGQNPLSTLTPTTAQALRLATVFDCSIAYPYCDVINSSPAIDVIGTDPNFQTLIFAVGDYGIIYAINVTTGKTLWTNYTGGGFSTSPAVGRYPVAAATQSVVYVIGPSRLYAYDEIKGNLLWYGNVAQGAGLNAEPTAPTVSNGIVYVASSDGHIYGFNPVACTVPGGLCTPTFVTSTITDGNVHRFISSPAVANGLVYIADFLNDTEYEVLGFNLGGGSPGSLQWQTISPGIVTRFPGSVTSSPAVLNGVVYIGVGLPAATGAGYLAAFNASTGALCWNPTFLPNLGTVYTSPAVVTENGLPFAYVGAGGGLYKINASCSGGGYVVWGPVIQAGDAIRFSSPAVADSQPGFDPGAGTSEVIFFGSTGGQLYAYDLNGNLIRNYPQTLGSAVEASPAVVYQTVYITNQDGFLYEFH